MIEFLSHFIPALCGWLVGAGIASGVRALYRAYRRRRAIRDFEELLARLRTEEEA
ncbi:membrane protein [Arthrobacter phage Bolt007]|uniref:Membrane protein n=1 Tax=Arthrobacter phage Bolt007 TaxID=3017297 RepID=A0AA49E5K7_9CAUD|nr:membrane protein [Arthrobacter phage Bolt007]